MNARSAGAPFDPHVVPVAGNGFFAVGSALETPNPVRWLEADQPGWLPFQIYVFTDGRDSLVIDAGLAVHRAALQRGLQSVLPAGKPPVFLLSRWEMDASANLAWLINAFEIREIHSVGELDPLDFFAGFEDAAANARLDAVSANARRVPRRPGDIVSHAGFEIELMSTSLRLLLTYWFYEHRTQSLFTSDSFSYLANPTGAYPFKATKPGQITTQNLLEVLRGKFEWLVGAHSGPIIGFLRELRRRPIERICPMYGGIIEGRDRVGEAFDAMEEALATLAAMTPRPAFEGFSLRQAVASPKVVDVERLQRPWAPHGAA